MSMFDIFQKPNFDDSIRHVEFRTHYPYVKSFGNNDIVEIALVVAWQIKKTEGNGSLSLAPNDGAFLFDSATYEQCGKEMDSVRDPGRVSTIRGYLCYNQHTSRDLAVAEWNYPTVPILHSEDLSFRMIFSLKHIFSIFNDYTKITCRKQSFRLVRARNDYDALKISDDKTKASIEINSIELKIVHIFPIDDIKYSLC